MTPPGSWHSASRSFGKVTSKAGLKNGTSRDIYASKDYNLGERVPKRDSSHVLVWQGPHGIVSFLILPRNSVTDLYDTLIVGGGPAGLTAALHLAWQQRKALVIDRVSGPLFFTLEQLWNVPGMPGATGAEIQKRLKAQALEMGAEVQRGNVVKAEGKEGDFLLTGEKGEQWRGRTLLLATGVIRYHPTIDGDFTPCFAYAGKGNLFYCVDCEGPELFGRDTIVIGTGPADWAAAMGVGLSRYTERLRVLLAGGRGPLRALGRAAAGEGHPGADRRDPAADRREAQPHRPGAQGRHDAHRRGLLRLQRGARPDRPRPAARRRDRHDRQARPAEIPARRHQRARRLDRGRPPAHDPAGRRRFGHRATSRR